MHSSLTNVKAAAARLLAQEAAAAQPGDLKASAAFQVCERLRRSLSKLTGSRGYRSLVCRALALAGEQIPWLSGLQVEPDGSLDGLTRLEAELSEKQIAAGETILVTQLLALLVTFIGPRLTQGILQDIWPTLEDLKF